MKAIQLKSITLRNWRGEKERTTQFHTDGTVTRICGRNGLGKSRHMDAFCWLLFLRMGYTFSRFHCIIKRIGFRRSGTPA